MCLITMTKRGKRAKEDIECYKIVAFNKLDGVYFTPYQNCNISNDIINGKEDFKAEGKIKIRGNSDKYEIGRGYIHTFIYLIDAMMMMSNFHDFLIFRCIIPKGTYYYKGLYGDYASRKIRFIEEIKCLNYIRF